MAHPAPQKTGLSDTIVFYCKDCHRVAPVERIARRFVYVCALCGTKNVAFGTWNSISRYFRVKEEVLEEGVAVPEEATKEVPGNESGAVPTEATALPVEPPTQTV